MEHQEVGQPSARAARTPGSQRPAIGKTLCGRRILRQPRGKLMQMRPDGGIGPQNGRLQFLQVFNYGVGAFRIIADAPCIQRQIKTPNPFSDVGQPQHCQTFVIRL
jgi:hypothetical protein